MESTINFICKQVWDNLVDKHSQAVHEENDRKNKIIQENERKLQEAA